MTRLWISRVACVCEHVCISVCVLEYTLLSECLHVYVRCCNVISLFATPQGRFMLANIVCIE